MLHRWLHCGQFDLHAIHWLACNCVNFWWRGFSFTHTRPSIAYVCRYEEYGTAKSVALVPERAVFYSFGLANFGVGVQLFKSGVRHILVPYLDERRVGARGSCIHLRVNLFGSFLVLES